MAQFDYAPVYEDDNHLFALKFEKAFDITQSTKWMQKNWITSVYLSIFYVIFIYMGLKVMERRKAYSLNKTLFYWNSCLALFSLIGSLRMAPELAWSARSNSFEYSICHASFTRGVSGFWTQLFAISKLAEFGDTVFIILRKRPLSFLHWYHHVTVLVYTWHAYKDHTASGRWFISMNYVVHTFMYAYYALRAKHFRLPKWSAMIITVLQIMQMIGGVFIGIMVYSIKQSGQFCQQTRTNLFFSFAIYFSYFLLFLNFFYCAYIKEGNRYMTRKMVTLKQQASGRMDNNKPFLEEKSTLNGDAKSFVGEAEFKKRL